MKEIAHMIERHEHHDDATQKIDGLNALAGKCFSHVAFGYCPKVRKYANGPVHRFKLLGRWNVGVKIRLIFQLPVVQSARLREACGGRDAGAVPFSDGTEAQRTPKNAGGLKARGTSGSQPTRPKNLFPQQK